MRFIRMELWITLFLLCKKSVNEELKNEPNIDGNPASNCNTNDITRLPCYNQSTTRVTDDDYKNTDIEDPETFTLQRILLGVSPSLTKILETTPSKFYDMKIAFAYRFLIRNQVCNFTEFESLMPQFWDDYVAGTADLDDIENFGHRYWNVSVKFKHNDKIATVEGHCGHPERVENCTVEKHVQLKRQQDLCFSGGLLECSAITNTCTCLMSYGTKTVRVNPKTGKPNSNGTACFILEGYPCLIRHYGVPDLKLPCTYKNICDSFTGICQRVWEIS